MSRYPSNSTLFSLLGKLVACLTITHSTFHLPHAHCCPALPCAALRCPVTSTRQTRPPGPETQRTMDDAESCADPGMGKFDQALLEHASATRKPPSIRHPCPAMHTRTHASGPPSQSLSHQKLARAAHSTKACGLSLACAWRQNWARPRPREPSDWPNALWDEMHQEAKLSSGAVPLGRWGSGLA